MAPRVPQPHGAARGGAEVPFGAEQSTVAGRSRAGRERCCRERGAGRVFPGFSAPPWEDSIVGLAPVPGRAAWAARIAGSSPWQVVLR